MTVYFRNTGKRQKQLPRHKGRQKGWQYRPATASAFEPFKENTKKGHTHKGPHKCSIRLHEYTRQVWYSLDKLFCQNLSSVKISQPLLTGPWSKTLFIRDGNATSLLSLHPPCIRQVTVPLRLLNNHNTACLTQNCM